MKLTRENWDKANKITYCIFKHGVLIYVGKRETFSYLGGEGCDFFPASEIKMPEEVKASNAIFDTDRIENQIKRIERWDNYEQRIKKLEKHYMGVCFKGEYYPAGTESKEAKEYFGIKDNLDTDHQTN